MKHQKRGTVAERWCSGNSSSASSGPWYQNAVHPTPVTGIVHPSPLAVQFSRLSRPLNGIPQPAPLAVHSSPLPAPAPLDANPTDTETTPAAQNKETETENSYNAPTENSYNSPTENSYNTYIKNDLHPTVIKMFNNNDINYYSGMDDPVFWSKFCQGSNQVCPVVSVLKDTSSYIRPCEGDDCKPDVMYLSANNIESVNMGNAPDGTVGGKVNYNPPKCLTCPQVSDCTACPKIAKRSWWLWPLYPRFATSLHRRGRCNDNGCLTTEQHVSYRSTSLPTRPAARIDGLAVKSINNGLDSNNIPTARFTLPPIPRYQTAAPQPFYGHGFTYTGTYATPSSPFLSVPTPTAAPTIDTHSFADIAPVIPRTTSRSDYSVSFGHNGPILVGPSKTSEATGIKTVTHRDTAIPAFFEEPMPSSYAEYPPPMSILNTCTGKSTSSEAQADSTPLSPIVQSSTSEAPVSQSPDGQVYWEPSTTRVSPGSTTAAKPTSISPPIEQFDQFEGGSDTLNDAAWAAAVAAYSIVIAGVFATIL